MDDAEKLKKPTTDKNKKKGRKKSKVKDNIAM